MRILPIALSVSALGLMTACVGEQPGAQHRVDTRPDVVVSRTYETAPSTTTTYVAPATTARSTYVAPDGTIVERQAVVPQAVVVEPSTTTTVVEERRYYNDDYIGRGNSQAERQALSRKFYNSCPPGAAKDRSC